MSSNTEDGRTAACLVRGTTNSTKGGRSGQNPEGLGEQMRVCRMPGQCSDIIGVSVPTGYMVHLHKMEYHLRTQVH